MKTNTLSLLALSSLAAASLHAATYTAGHGDLGVGYHDEGSGPELHPHLHLHTGAIVDGTPLTADTELHAHDTTIQFANPITMTSTNPALLTGIGTTTGSTLHLLPASGTAAATAGVPFLGIASEELTPADWVGNLNIIMTNLTGPGEFALYQTDTFGQPEFALSTNTGATTFQLPIGTHAHYNYTFTQPGTYNLTLNFTGEHTTDGIQTATETFTFNVIPEPSTALLSGLSLLALIQRRRTSYK